MSANAERIGFIGLGAMGSGMAGRLIYVEKGEVVDHFAPRELAGAYAGWTAVRQADRLISCAQDGRPHRHRVEEFVARAVAPAQEVHG